MIWYIKPGLRWPDLLEKISERILPRKSSSETISKPKVVGELEIGQSINADGSKAF